MQGVVNLITHRAKNVGKLTAAIESLTRKRALVGVPAENSSRQTGDKINNAELLYILSHGVRKGSMIAEMDADMDRGRTYNAAYELYIREHGSPLWAIPPRPVLEPGVKSRQKEISLELAEASRAAIRGDNNAVDLHLDNAGQLGEDGAKAWFEDPRNNWPPNSPKTIAKKGSDKPLQDTGEMKKSITHVMREV